jgi:hypothetical protein
MYLKAAISRESYLVPMGSDECSAMFAITEGTAPELTG